MLSSDKRIVSTEHDTPSKEKKTKGRNGKNNKVFGKYIDRIFALAKPASTLAKPRFIKNTRTAARNTHKVSVIE